jgi:hypothetical protein
VKHPEKWVLISEILNKFPIRDDLYFTAIWFYGIGNPLKVEWQKDFRIINGIQKGG